MKKITKAFEKVGKNGVPAKILCFIFNWTREFPLSVKKTVRNLYNLYSGDGYLNKSMEMNE